MPQHSGADRAKVRRSIAGWTVWLKLPRVLLVGAAIVFAGLLIGYVGTVLFVFPPQRAEVNLTRVPDLVGRTPEEARARAERSKLGYEEVGGIHHGDSARVVLAQEPLSGQLAEPGSPIRVTVNLGPKQRALPNVVGLGRAQAEIVLKQAGYKSELEWVDDDADVGLVVDTEPGPATALALSSTVRVLVSAGSRVVQVPDLVTRSLVEARSSLDRLGLQLGEVTPDSASLAAPGTVLAQVPDAGTRVSRGTPIAVVVAGPSG